MRLRRTLVAAALAAAGCASDVPQNNTVTGGYVRVANLAPNLGPIDFCFRFADGGVFQGPRLASAGETAGLVFGNAAKQVSTYNMYVSTAWVFRVVRANAADCGTPIAPDITIPVGPPAYTTIAVIGSQGAIDAPVAQEALVDQITTGDAQVRLRFVNAGFSGDTAPLPPMDGGLGPFTPPSAFHVLFPAVRYPVFAAQSSTVDPYGYVLVAPTDVASSSWITACVAGQPPDLTSCPISQQIGNAGIPGSYVGTAYAVGGTSSGAARMLICLDSAFIVSNYAPCW